MSPNSPIQVQPRIRIVVPQNGLSEGSFSGIGIDSDGIVSINYSNGSAREIYQIPIAQFNSPDNLQRHFRRRLFRRLWHREPLNLYTPAQQAPARSPAVRLNPRTVDIAIEFTNLITAQQVYSANAKIVTTINQMLNTIIQAVQ